MAVSLHQKSAEVAKMTSFARTYGTLALAVCFAVVPLQAQKDKDKDKGMATSGSANRMTNGPDRITREVRHELVMLPYYGVFDNLLYKVDGTTVTLMGQVTRPTLK